MSTQSAPTSVLSATNSATNLVKVSGRFDAHMAPGVGARLDQCLTNGHRVIIVDLSDAHFVDSTALAVLVRGMKRARERGGDLLLCSLQTPVRIIFELTRMDRAFTIIETVDTVLASQVEGVAQE